MTVAVTFLAPSRLWLLALVPGLAVAYVFLQRTRRHHAVRFTNLELLASVAPRRPGWRRHVPAAAMALALGGLVLGLARPARQQRIPKRAATVMLALDTSASMEATDVAPTRIRAATSAALKFVDDLPTGLSVGLVTFDRVPRVLAPPTTEHAVVEQALQQLATGPGTAAGDAVDVALDAINTSGKAAIGNKHTAAIVLLSDGVTTVGRSVEQAAQDAADQGVTVTTIAFGTDQGTVDVRGRIVPVPADNETMAAVAEITGGKFFEAASGSKLRSVYADIGTRVGYTVHQREIGLTFVAASVVLLVAGLVTALVWSARLL